MNRSLRAMTLGLCLLAAAAPLRAADVNDFKLSQAVPGNSVLVLHARDHAGMEWVEKQYARVWRAVEELHFEQDLTNLMKALAEESGEDSAEMEAAFQKVGDACMAVDWAALAGREFTMAMALEFPTVNFVFLMMPEEGKTDAQFESLSQLAKMLVNMAPPGELSLATTGEGSQTVHRVSITNAPLPIGIVLARHQDIILMGFGSLAEQSLAMLQGEGGDPLHKSDRFRNAVKPLPKAGETLFFMDVAMMMQQVRSVISQGISMADPQGNMMTEMERTLPGKLVDEFDIFETVAEVTMTNGMKTTTNMVTQFKSSANVKPFYQFLFGGGQLDQPMRYFPKEALNCAAYSGLNIDALYKGTMNFVKNNVPDGESLINEMQVQLQTLKSPDQPFPIDVENGIIAAIGGEFRTFSIPGRSAYSPPEWAMMVSLRDEQRFGDIYNRAMGMVSGMLEAQQQGSLNDAKIDGADGFKVLASPMLIMLPQVGTPTFGIKDGYLMMASSPRTIALALKTAAGENDNFSKNERYAKEGLPLKSGVTSYSFADMTTLGDDLSQVLAIFPMMMAFNPAMGKNPAAKTLIGVTNKLSRVVRKLDFFQSTCSTSQMNGNTLTTTTVMNYREPPKATGESSSSEDAS